MVLYSTRIKTALRNASLVIRMRRTLPDGIHLVGQASLQRGLYYILVWIWSRNLADSQCVLPRQLETGPLASEVRELLSQVPATKFGQQLWLRHSVAITTARQRWWQRRWQRRVVCSAAAETSIILAHFSIPDPRQAAYWWPPF